MRIIKDDISLHIAVFGDDPALPLKTGFRGGYQGRGERKVVFLRARLRADLNVKKNRSGRNRF